MFLYDSYDELDYIQSSGTQYINTGISKAGNGGTLQVTMNFQFVGTSDKTQGLFGSCAFNIGQREMNQFIGGSTSKNWIMYWRTYEGSPYSGGSWNLNTTYSINSYFYRYGIWLDVNGSRVISDSDISGDYQSGTEFLFAINDVSSRDQGSVGAPKFFSKIKLYKCQCWKDGTLVRTYIPARRKSDGAIGLFDTVGERFYGNAGSGVFTYGKVIIKNPIALKVNNAWKDSEAYVKVDNVWKLSVPYIKVDGVWKTTTGI